MVELSARGLVPLTAADDELLSQFKPGQMFDLVPRDKERSRPQVRFYFAVLQRVCAATGLWPKADILHDFLMRECGYSSTQLNPFTERWEEVRDSLAFDGMSQDEANEFVTAAMAAIATWLGIDPVELLPKRGKTRHDTAA